MLPNAILGCLISTIRWALNGTNDKQDLNNVLLRRQCNGFSFKYIPEWDHLKGIVCRKRRTAKSGNGRYFYLLDSFAVEVDALKKKSIK